MEVLTIRFFDSILKNCSIYTVISLAAIFVVPLVNILNATAAGDNEGQIILADTKNNTVTKFYLS